MRRSDHTNPPLSLSLSFSMILAQFFACSTKFVNDLTSSFKRVVSKGGGTGREKKLEVGEKNKRRAKQGPSSQLSPSLPPL
jgi:hypothetical protein